MYRKEESRSFRESRENAYKFRATASTRRARARNSKLGRDVTPCQATPRYGIRNSRGTAHNGPGNDATWSAGGFMGASNEFSPLPGPSLPLVRPSELPRKKFRCVAYKNNVTTSCKTKGVHFPFLGTLFIRISRFFSIPLTRRERRLSASFTLSLLLFLSRRNVRSFRD